MVCVPSALRATILMLAGFVCACETTSDQTRPHRFVTNEPAKIDPAEPYDWFRAASKVRRCYGWGSTEGAQRTALVAAVGFERYKQRAPLSVVAGKAGHDRASMLAYAAYAGSFDVSRVKLACHEAANAALLYYRRSDAKTQWRLADSTVSLMKSDATGRLVIAQRRMEHDERPRTRARSRGSARPLPRSTLKPGEQQLPVGE